MNIEEATINAVVFRIIGFEGFKDLFPWPHSVEGMGRRKYCLEQIQFQEESKCGCCSGLKQWFFILQNKGLGIIIQLKEKKREKKLSLEYIYIMYN